MIWELCGKGVNQGADFPGIMGRKRFLACRRHMIEAVAISLGTEIEPNVLRLKTMEKRRFVKDFGGDAVYAGFVNIREESQLMELGLEDVGELLGRVVAQDGQLEHRQAGRVGGQCASGAHHR